MQNANIHLPVKYYTNTHKYNMFKGIKQYTLYADTKNMLKPEDQFA